MAIPVGVAAAPVLGCDDVSNGEAVADADGRALQAAPSDWLSCRAIVEQGGAEAVVLPVPAPVIDPVAQLSVSARAADGRCHALVVPDPADELEVVLDERSSQEAGGVHRGTWIV